MIFTASGAALSAIKYAVIRNSTGAGAGKVLAFCTLSTAAFSISSPNTLTILPAAPQEHEADLEALNKAILECEDKATVERMMDLMLTEAAHHFRHEQELLARWKYPDTAAHTAKHAQLIAQFERVMKGFAQTDISFVWALKGLHLKQLLVEHLLQEDMKYRDFLRAQERPS